MNIPSSDGPQARHVPVDAPPVRDFRVDGWLVEPSRNRLVRGGTAVRVRPQLIDVLTCLAARPGQVVSKARLLSEVWADRYVAESGVSRCMAELRQLLEDDARQPRIIETIPKRGYRLIAPVVHVETEGPRLLPARPAPARSPTPGATGAPACEAVAPGARSTAAGWWNGGMARAARLFLAAAGVLTELARQLARRVAS
jgi:DNA-binding winged helix-turn-helix (wHTH) protein